ncbi:DUF4238 domain-containing protein [Janthinobacterium sp. PLB04]|uniref:hypothetical protein n=1 Tax=Janthinobacterium TaxID=29580 RepID=UPI00124936C9|nr:MULTISPECIES: hypothetical protein [Janthinobacterium]KAB0331013.1 hypothetical protein F3B38_04510 [Janthinobacterium lividum]UGQ34318.1 DUF4238 domain-containing protein [Janthinobacterium sp. PLB04]
MTRDFESLPANNTENQHFIAQAIQSLNATPSEDGEISHIAAYRKVGGNLISPVPRVLRPIRSNLAVIDLYTFDVENRLRRNYEKLFHDFESKVPEHTLSVIEKVRAGNLDIQMEVKAILRAKFMDFVRNPYNIRTCLQIFPQLATSSPTDSRAAEIQQKVLNGYNPRQDRICKILKITAQEYRNWLSTMFILLYPIPGIDIPLLDQILESLTGDNTSVSGSFIMVYDKPVVLLSDRAANVALPSQNNFTLEFHASAHMLITLYVLPLAHVSETMKLAPPAWSEEALNEIIKKFPELRSLIPPGGVGPEMWNVLFKKILPSHESGFQIKAVQNDLLFAEAYNQRTVEQCKELVYGRASTFPGVIISNI